MSGDSADLISEAGAVDAFNRWASPQTQGAAVLTFDARDVWLTAWRACICACVVAVHKEISKTDGRGHLQ